MGPVAAPLGGFVESGFEPVREAFASNFGTGSAPPPSGWGEPGEDPGDLGAALCVILDGRVVVDLWGGWADVAGTRPWERDTLANIYSLGKAVSAVAALALVARGLLDFDAPLARVWPELDCHDKGTITMRHVLAHRAGLPGVRRSMTLEEFLDFDTMTAALAAEAPWWEPGTAHGYHVSTFGHLVGEPVRRVTGERFGSVVRGLVCEPLGADLWLGLPSEHQSRCAEVDFIQEIPPELIPHQGDDDLSRMRRAAYFNPPGMTGIGSINTAAWRAAEVPSTNMQGTARGVAAVFASLAGGFGGAEPVPASLLEEAVMPASTGEDLVLDRESRFGLGFMLHQEGRPVGVSEGSFGHYGNGGSLGFADRDAGIGFAYLLNRPGDRWQVPRTRRILSALRVVIGAG